MKFRKPRRRISIFGIIVIVIFSYAILLKHPKSILSRTPRDFVSIAPYIPPISSPPLFTVPQILFAHCRQECKIISLFTSGIDMPISERNLTAIACRIGEYIVPALKFEEDVLHCPADRLAPGVVLAPVLLRDETFWKAVKGPVKLATGIVAELHEEDLAPLDGLSVHSSLNRDELALIQSDYIYQPPPHSKTQWRWQVCLMIQIKPATYLLPDWVDYHRRVGVDHVFIFDNGASTDIASMFSGRNDVEVIRWPYHKAQLQLVGYFLLASRNICEYVLHMDADEFFMFGLGTRRDFGDEPPLPRYIRRMKDKGFYGFQPSYIIMTNSGYRLRPEGSVPDNFLHRSEKQVFFNGKAVCSTDLDYESGLVHACGITNGKHVRLYSERPKEWGEINMFPRELDDPAFVVHYRERSWEEWIERTNAGWIVGRLVKDAMKNKLDIDKPDEKYMAYNKSLRYTHFREVFRRVMNEGRLDRTYTVRRDDNGRRCVREISTVTHVLPLATENCWDT